MNLHRKVSALFAHYQAKDLQARQNLYLTIKKRELLLNERDELNGQISVLKKLIKEYNYNSCKDRTTLFEEMRKVAVLRRKLQAINLQYQQNQTSLDEISAKKREICRLLQVLQNKAKKFTQLLNQLKVIQLKKSFSEEETELEEYLS